MGSAWTPPELDVSTEKRRLDEIFSRLDEIFRTSLPEIRQQASNALGRLETVTGVLAPEATASLRSSGKLITEFADTIPEIARGITDYAIAVPVQDRMEQEAARLRADVAQAFDAKRDAALRRLASLGVDPSQVRATALDRVAGIQQAAAEALAGARGRALGEQQAIALRERALGAGVGVLGAGINVGRLGTAQAAQAADTTVRQAALLPNIYGTPGQQLDRMARTTLGRAGLEEARFRGQIERARIKAGAKANMVNATSNLLGTGAGLALGYAIYG
ncbi:MAG TPA: hypothetical protein ENI87_05370 [bacterium]|nr:hypothetical protein [bacterium]